MTGGDLTGHYPGNHQEDEYGNMERPQIVLASIQNAIPPAVPGLKNREGFLSTFP